MTDIKYTDLRVTNPAQPIADGDLIAVAQDISGTETSAIALASDIKEYVLAESNSTVSNISSGLSSTNSTVSNISSGLSSTNSSVSSVSSGLALKADLRLTTNTQTASYTLVLSDAGKEVIMDVASANNLTVPPASSVAWTAGDQTIVFQKGAGLTTVVAGSGVTIRNRHATLKTLGQYSSLYLRYRGSDLWVITGELAES